MPARLYRPRPGLVPLVVYAHGGGWTIGDLDTHDRICRRLACTSGAAVLSVGYRLAPEHPAPAAVDDVVHVLEWVATTPAELDPAAGAVAVAGDSAGGTLAALACLRLRDARSAARPDLQVLVCAKTDLTGPGASMVQKGTGWGLDVSGVEFFNWQWVSDPDRWSDPGHQPFARNGPARSTADAGRHRQTRPATRPGRGLTPTGCARPAYRWSCAGKTGWSTTF